MRMNILLILIHLLNKTAAVNKYYTNRLAVNDYLLIFLREGMIDLEDSIKYQCSGYGNKIFELDFHLKPIHSVSIGREQNQSQLYFLVSGIINESTCFMSKITVQCNNDHSEVLKTDTIFFENYFMSNMVVTIDPHGRFAIGFTHISLFYYDMINLQQLTYNITWPDGEISSMKMIMRV
ncbi:hypothetical protein I4U23_003795 [Adineta vaga]|nr:hypothetical protein I4U23_003795 [Adineta vaga]